MAAVLAVGILVWLVLGVTGGALAQGLEDLAPEDVEGTYTFRVRSADSLEVVAEGQFVLSAEPFDLGRIDDTLVSNAGRRSRWLLARDGSRARVCFGFYHSRSHVDGREFYGGIIPAGLSDWTLKDGEVRVHVYQSPDASQHLAWTVTPEGVRGHVLQRDWDAWTTGAPLEWLPLEITWFDKGSTDRCEHVLRNGADRSAADPAAHLVSITPACYALAASGWQPHFVRSEDRQPRSDLVLAVHESGTAVFEDRETALPVVYGPAGRRATGHWWRVAPDSIAILLTNGFAGVRMRLKVEEAQLEGTGDGFIDVVLPGLKEADPDPVYGRRIDCETREPAGGP